MNAWLYELREENGWRTVTSTEAIRLIRSAWESSPRFGGWSEAAREQLVQQQVCAAKETGRAIQVRLPSGETGEIQVTRRAA